MPPIVTPITGTFSMLPANGETLVALLSLQTIAGNRAYYASTNILAPALMTQWDAGGQQSVMFGNGLLEAPQFKATGTVATSTSAATIENVSGDTVQRANSVFFAANELWGAYFIFQLWHPAQMVSKILVQGNVLDAEDNGDSLRLTLRTSSNWSEVQACNDLIGPNCNLTWGTPQCGSTASTPCNNDWGSCTSQNRFKGVVPQWDEGAISTLPAVSYAQPAPLVGINSRRMG